MLTSVRLVFEVFAVSTKGANINIYVAAIAVMFLDILIEMVMYNVFGYINSMKIEQKYEFNNMTKKTFFVDLIKNLILELVLVSALTCIVAFLYHTFGNQIFFLLVFIIFLLMLFVNFMAPIFIRIFNKLVPLE